MSRSQPGDRVGMGGSTRAMTLGRLLGTGASAQVFEVAEDADVVAKMYLGEFPERLRDLLPHFRRVFYRPDGRVIGEGAICAFPILPLMKDGAPAGFLMRRFRIGDGGEYMTLEEFLECQAATDPVACLEIARRLARDVGFFHSRGLIVSDMSLRNILIKATGQVAWVDLDSFGAEAVDGLPPVAAFARTARFFPPELLDGRAPCGVESDRFALGMHLLTLLTAKGLHPYGVERVGGQSTDQTRVERGETWMVAPGDYYKVSHRGLLDWPDDLAELGRALLVDGYRDPSARPSAARWLEVLGAVRPDDLIVPAAPRRTGDAGPRPSMVRGPGAGPDTGVASATVPGPRATDRPGTGATGATGVTGAAGPVDPTGSVGLSDGAAPTGAPASAPPAARGKGRTFLLMLLVAVVAAVVYVVLVQTKAIGVPAGPEGHCPPAPCPMAGPGDGNGAGDGDGATGDCAPPAAAGP